MLISQIFTVRVDTINAFQMKEYIFLGDLFCSFAVKLSVSSIQT